MNRLFCLLFCFALTTCQSLAQEPAEEHPLVVGQESASDAAAHRELGRRRQGKHSGMRKKKNIGRHNNNPSLPGGLGMITIQSNQDFHATWDALVSQVSGFPFFEVVDHSGAASSIGETLLPNRLAVFGNPVLGTPIMIANQDAGIDFPQKMLVWEDEKGNVFVGYSPPEYLIARYFPRDRRVLKSLEGSFNTIATRLNEIATTAAGKRVKKMVKDEVKPLGRLFSRRNDGLRKVRSMTSFNATVHQLVTAIENAKGPSIFLLIDHSANAPVGLDLDPTYLVVFGAAAIGTPLMQVDATFGADLPLKILVVEKTDSRNNKKVFVIANEVDFLRKRHQGLLTRELDDRFNGIDMALTNFINAATAA